MVDLIGPAGPEEKKDDSTIFLLTEEATAEIRALRESILRKKEVAEDLGMQIMALEQRQREVRSVYGQEVDRLGQRLKLMAMSLGLDLDKDPNWVFDYTLSSFRPKDGP